MTKLLFTNLLILSIVCANPAKSQEAPQVEMLPDSFYTVFNNHLPIFNGRLFFGYPAVRTGHAFYPGKNWSPVKLHYDGVWYNATALYDVYTDDLVLLNPDSTSPFVIYGDRVSSFFIDGHAFLRLDDKTDALLKNGFYEVIAQGSFAVFIKRRKTILEEIRDGKLEREFVAEDHFFIRKNNQFYRIRNKADLYALIKEKKPEILKSIRSSKLKFKKNPEAVITLAAGFYK